MALIINKFFGNQQRAFIITPQQTAKNDNHNHPVKGYL